MAKLGISSGQDINVQMNVYLTMNFYNSLLMAMVSYTQYTPFHGRVEDSFLLLKVFFLRLVLPSTMLGVWLIYSLE